MAIIYVVLAVGCVIWGSSLTDPEASTVLMQLPVVPVLGFLVAFGLMDRAAGTSILVFYGLCIPTVAIVLYAACWLLGTLSSRTRLIFGFGALGLLLVMLFWPGSR